MKAARAALAQNNPAQDRAALLCLLAAASGTADELRAYEDGKRAIHLPSYAGVNQTPNGKERSK